MTQSDRIFICEVPTQYGVIYGKKEAKTYQIYVKCIMDSSDINIIIDHNGVCDYCKNFETVISPNWHTDAMGSSELYSLPKKVKSEGKNKDFDCIIGLSGGIDSSYVAYIAKVKMRLRPLLFHLDAGWNANQAVENIVKKLIGRPYSIAIPYTSNYRQLLVRARLREYLESNCTKTNSLQNHYAN